MRLCRDLLLVPATLVLLFVPLGTSECRAESTDVVSTETKAEREANAAIEIEADERASEGATNPVDDALGERPNDADRLDADPDGRSNVADADRATQENANGNGDTEEATSDHLEARLIRVPVPITGNVDTRVKEQLRYLIDTWKEAAGRPVLVLEFWPPENRDKGNGSEFERSLSLARFLASDKLQGVRTVAYLPRTIRGHAVLPVLACEEIIMHPDATLGQAGVDETAIDETVRQGYEEIADQRRTIPPPVALGMLDRDLKVYKVATASGTRYVTETNLEDLQTNTNIQSMETVVGVGDMGDFTGKSLRLNHGFVSHLAVDRRELAAALNVAISDLDSNTSIDGGWTAALVSIDGLVNDMMVERVQRAVGDTVRADQANLILVHVDSPGGSPDASLRLANYLSSLDGSEVRTAAYVDHEARADAAMIVLACDDILMTPDAIIGGEGLHQPSDEEIADLSEAVKSMSHDKSRRWSIPVAMFDPTLAVHRYALQGTNVAEYFCADELAEQQAPERWTQGDEVTSQGAVQTVRGMDAVQLGIARSIVDNENEMRSIYQLTEAPTPLEPSWVDDLVTVLAKPQIAAILLFVGCFALIGELSAPGIGVGGFLSALCFVVYFWTQTMNQTAGLLEVLLFLTGGACILAEIFVIPGFGIFGLGGGLLVLASLVLASQSFVIPQNGYQLNQLASSLMAVVAGMAGTAIGLFVMRQYFDRVPGLRHVILSPPRGEDLDELHLRESLVDYSHLLNQTGITTTQVVPSGKAQFGRQIVDVMSDSEYIERGAPVRVIDVQGNRVLVEPVSASTDSHS